MHNRAALHLFAPDATTLVGLEAKRLFVGLGGALEWLVMDRELIAELLAVNGNGTRFPTTVRISRANSMEGELWIASVLTDAQAGAGRWPTTRATTRTMANEPFRQVAETLAQELGDLLTAVELNADLLPRCNEAERTACTADIAACAGRGISLVRDALAHINPSPRIVR